MYQNNTIMKKVLITLAMLLALGMGAQAAGQKHRHTPQQELSDSTGKDGVVVYSDTSSIDTVTVTNNKAKVTVTTKTSPWSSRTTTYEVDDDDFGGMIHNAFSHMGSKDIAGMFFVLCVLLIIFVLAPVFIIIALFYFINKNRKEKMRLAQMAMQQGQPIPDQLLNDKPVDADNEYQSGMRQCFVGVGLMIFLGYAAGSVGFGIGALVFCIGLGKVFASKTANRREQGFRDLNSQNRRDNNDDLTQNNYD
jgi:hypothetical protein